MAVALVVLLWSENFEVGKVVVVFVAVDVVDMEGGWQLCVVGVGVVRGKLTVEVECGEIAGELVVVELEVDTVPGGPHGDCKQVVGCEVGREGWGVWIGWCWLWPPSEGLLVHVRVELPPPAHALTVHHKVKFSDGHACGSCGSCSSCCCCSCRTSSRSSSSSSSCSSSSSSCSSSSCCCCSSCSCSCTWNYISKPSWLLSLLLYLLLTPKCFTPSMSCVVVC